MMRLTGLIKRMADQWLPQSVTKPMAELTQQRIKYLKTKLTD